MVDTGVQSSSVSSEAQPVLDSIPRSNSVPNLAPILSPVKKTSNIHKEEPPVILKRNASTFKGLETNSYFGQVRIISDLYKMLYCILICNEHPSSPLHWFLPTAHPSFLFLNQYQA
jgi:hypothetical protein